MNLIKFENYDTYLNWHISETKKERHKIQCEYFT